MKRKIIRIKSADHRQKLIVLSPKNRQGLVSGILWIHGGGFMFGMAAMVYDSCGKDIAKAYGGVVVSPGYRLASRAPYPAAVNDCYEALEYMWDHAEELGVDRDRIVVGGESAGGGLAAAVCLMARDKGKIKVAMQIPLYPMLDCDDTESSRDNHGKVWNTRWNHWGWKHYLGKLYGSDDVPAYASPAKANSFANLPPCYTYVCDGEPFYCETLAYVQKLKDAGVPAKVDVFPGDVHAFDYYTPWKPYVKTAKQNRLAAFKAIIIDGKNEF